MKRERRPAPAVRTKGITPGKLAKTLAAQKRAGLSARTVRNRLAKARDAVSGFKPRKADRGKILMVGVGGGRDPQSHGRKGYPVYITKTGKKWLLRVKGKEQYKARKISDLQLPARRNLKQAVGAFGEKRIRQVERGKPAPMRKPNIVKGDWNKARGRLVENLYQRMNRQKGFRDFMVRANVLVRLPDGSKKAVEINVPLGKPANVKIPKKHLTAFVDKMFYAHMARELAYLGLVTQASKNHIRRLDRNAGKPQSEWKDKRGDLWAGRDLDVVKIEVIDWQVEQNNP